MTGSGILVRELWRCASARGDEQRLIVAGYPGDDYRDPFDGHYSLLTYTGEGQEGQLPFPVMGMSDVMPYRAMRFADASARQVESHVNAFRAKTEELIDEFEPDVIHIHHLWVLVALSRYSRGVPCFVTIHGTDLKQLSVAPRFKTYVEAGLGNVSHFFSVSRDVMADARTSYGLPRDKVSFIGNGYNEEIFRPDGPAARCREKVILAAGKFVDWKGFRFLIRACEGLQTPYRLVIAGSGPEEKRRGLIEEAVRSRVDGRILLTGHIPQAALAEWMRRADVFVLPSINEPFGLVFLEAMACGCPVVASDCGGAKDVIRETGLNSLDLASLIPPLEEGDLTDEGRYVSDIRRALEQHLAAELRPEDRTRIAASVTGREWKHVYQVIRGRYVSAPEV
jgi:glycosyltransferase involved in cell wall biosynthesis